MAKITFQPRALRIVEESCKHCQGSLGIFCIPPVPGSILDPVIRQDNKIIVYIVYFLNYTYILCILTRSPAAELKP